MTAPASHDRPRGPRRRSAMSGPDRRAFTLVELCACLVILVLGCAMVAVNLRSPTAAQRLDDAVDRVLLADAQARGHARRHGAAVTWRLEPNAGEILRWRERDAANEAMPPLVLPTGCRIAEAWTADSTSRGPATVRHTPDGGTPDFVLALAVEGRPERWVVVAGLTGAAIEVDRAEQARRLIGAR